MAHRPLTRRQWRFIDAFLDRGSGAFLNATQAARLAGYAWPEKQGPRLLTMPAVHKWVEIRFKLQYLAARDERGRLVPARRKPSM